MKSKNLNYKFLPFWFLIFSQKRNLQSRCLCCSMMQFNFSCTLIWYRSTLITPNFSNWCGCFPNINDSTRADGCKNCSKQIHFLICFLEFLFENIWNCGHLPVKLKGFLWSFLVNKSYVYIEGYLIKTHCMYPWSLTHM